MDDHLDKLRHRGEEIAVAHTQHPELRIIVSTGYEKWLIKSMSGDIPRFVYYDYDDGWVCSCPYFLYRGKCKHIFCMEYIRTTKVFIPQYDSELDGEQTLDL